MAKREMVGDVAIYADRSCTLRFPDGSKTRFSMDVDGGAWLDCGEPVTGGFHGVPLKRDETAAAQWARRVCNKCATEQDKALLAFCEKRVRESWDSTGA